MKNNCPQEIEHAVYMTATLLAEALSAFGHAETIRAYDASFSDGKSKPAATMIALSETGSDLAISDDIQKKLLEELKSQVLALVQAGDLLPMGFKLPRASTDNPIEISLEIFIAGQINWNKSELQYEDTEFSAVKLLETEAQKIKMNKFHRAGTVIGEKKKSEKTEFSELGPSQMVNEKEAAKYLQISPRNFQALRVKGEGPAFVKLGQAIRYKMADLIEWENKR